MKYTAEKFFTDLDTILSPDLNYIRLTKVREIMVPT